MSYATDQVTSTTNARPQPVNHIALQRFRCCNGITLCDGVRSQWLLVSSAPGVTATSPACGTGEQRRCRYTGDWLSFQGTWCSFG